MSVTYKQHEEYDFDIFVFKTDEFEFAWELQDEFPKSFCQSCQKELINDKNIFIILIQNTYGSISIVDFKLKKSLFGSAFSIAIDEMFQLKEDVLPCKPTNNWSFNFIKKENNF